MLKGAYRLLNCPDVDIEAIWHPHHEATRQAAGAGKTVLMIQDWTTLDYSHHPHTRGLGPVGSRQQRGMLLHSVLAYEFETQRILGLAYGQVIVREAPGVNPAKPPHNGGRRSEGMEGRAWEQAAVTIGRKPAGSTSQWIHVSDRESDVFEYLAVCRALEKDFVVRAFHNRKIDRGEAVPTADEATSLPPYLMTQARAMASPSEMTYAVDVSATVTHGVKQPKRTAQIQLAWMRLHLPAPSYVKDDAGLDVWIVRAWEPAPPPDAEAVEWILITSLPVTDWQAARYVTQLYECRWLIEDYHMGLKTGCRMEASQLDDGDDLQRLLGFNALIAIRLMQLRQIARTAPDTPATQIPTLDPLWLQLVAAKFQVPEHSLTVQRFWMFVAQLGGHLGRKSDGPPGWRTLWKGWHHLTDWAEGVRILMALKSG
jgi:hypothetical protein